MLTRRKVLGLAAMAFVTAAPAHAAGVTPYTRAAFEAAQKDGKSILVEIHASWCPTCKAQDPIINGLLGSAKFKDMVAFRIDFDSQKDEVRAMGAQTQSTLIAFKGAQEMARSVGDTDPASIEKLFASAV
jgi:thioredoxin 1